MLLILSLFVLGALWLARWFIRHDKGELEPRRALWGSFCMGVVAMIVAGILESIFIQHDITNPDLFFSTRTLFIDFMLVGIIEEAVKFLPLLVWLWRKPYFTERTDGVIYFALGGLGFGFAENILYTLADGAGTGIGRLIIVSFFHAALTGAAGYFVARAKAKGLPIWSTLLPLAVVMVLHGLYDFGLASGTPMFVLGALSISLYMTIGMFTLFGRAARVDALVPACPTCRRQLSAADAICQNCVAKGPGPMAPTGV